MCFSGMSCFLQFARRQKLPESEGIKKKNYYRAFPSLVAQIGSKAGILHNCDFLLTKNHLQIYSYYTVDVFHDKNDHPSSKQVSVHAALCFVCSGSSSLSHP